VDAMGFAWRTWLKTLCICGGFLAVAGVAAEHTAPLVPIDELVTPWSDFGIKEYTFIGTWGETYKAAVWLRLMPTSNSDHREARIVFQLTRSPALISDSKKKLQHVTSQGFLVGGKLPEIAFTAVATSRDRVERVVVKQQYWEQYATRESLGRTVNGRAVLKADTMYTLSMEGSQRLYQIPAFRSSKPNALFQAGDAWIGIVEDFMPERSPKPFQFAVLQHLRYHLQLGFTGTLMVVVPETAALLLADAGVVDAVKKQQLVLVLWVSHHPRRLCFPAKACCTACSGSSPACRGHQPAPLCVPCCCVTRHGHWPVVPSCAARSVCHAVACLCVVLAGFNTLHRLWLLAGFCAVHCQHSACWLPRDSRGWCAAHCCHGLQLAASNRHAPG
jgi:hypothetical protein